MSGAVDRGEGNSIAGTTTAGSTNDLSSRTSAAASEPSTAPVVSTMFRPPPVPVPSLATEDAQPPKTPSEAVSPSPAPTHEDQRAGTKASTEKPESPEKSVWS